jgi:hypothetical protein
MNSLKNEGFLPSQPTQALLGQFFAIIINLSKLLMPSLDHCKFVITLAKLNYLFSFNLRPNNPKDLLGYQCNMWKLGFMCNAPHQRVFTILGFTHKHWNIFNSFLNKECIASSFETPNPKINHHL